MFLLAKDPAVEQGGDIELSRVAMRLAAESFDVSAICLSHEAPGWVQTDVVDGGLPLLRVPQHPVAPLHLLTGSLRHIRSLAHVRFDTEELRAAIARAIAEVGADVFVAEHSYMAESYLRVPGADPGAAVINTINTESQVWLATRGLLGRIEAPRLLRDELRVARRVAAVGCYEIEEAEMYRRNGVPGARFMEVTLPPTDQIDISVTPRRLVFFGRRDWPPNQEAFLHALRLWPRIADGVADAELCIVGSKKPGARDPVYPDGVRDIGFVEDLPQFLAGCRALMAPIKTGGGVRVKLLDSISQGLPVIGTGPAVGSLKTLLGMPTFDSDDAFVAECRRLLLDRDAAVAVSDHLYQTNTEHWRNRRPQQAVESLVQAGLRV